MTVDKNFKRLVRARMVKTGEGYTSARQAILNERAAPTTIVELMTRARDAGHDSLGLMNDDEVAPPLRKHWSDCAVNHGGAECDMGPDCGKDP
jgi:hypothetical protein